MAEGFPRLQFISQENRYFLRSCYRILGPQCIKQKSELEHRRSYSKLLHFLWFLPLCRLFTWRGRNSRNQWEKCGKPNCGSATEDPGKFTSHYFNVVNKVTANISCNSSAYTTRCELTHLSSHAERNQRRRHNEDRSQPAEPIPSLWGNNVALGIYIDLFGLVVSFVFGICRLQTVSYESLYMVITRQWAWQSNPMMTTRGGNLQRWVWFHFFFISSTIYFFKRMLFFVRWISS